MIHLSKQQQILEQLIDYQIHDQLNEEQTSTLYQKIAKFLREPDATDYTLECIATRIIKMGVDYEAYVSALIFKSLPDEFTKRDLVKLEDEIYAYIEKEVYGKGLDKRLSEQLLKQVARDKPQLSPAMVEKKALGNWGWLLPHALTQLLIDRIMEFVDHAKTESNRSKKKGRKIRIKKMD